LGGWFVGGQERGVCSAPEEERGGKKARLWCECECTSFFFQYRTKLGKAKIAEGRGGAEGGRRGPHKNGRVVEVAAASPGVEGRVQAHWERGCGGWMGGDT